MGVSTLTSHSGPAFWPPQPTWGPRPILCVLVTHTLSLINTTAWRQVLPPGLAEQEMGPASSRLGWSWTALPCLSALKPCGELPGVQPLWPLSSALARRCQTFPAPSHCLLGLGCPGVPSHLDSVAATGDGAQALRASVSPAELSPNAAPNLPSVNPVD